MKGKKRILVLTLSFGAGHVRAAESVIAELRKQLPEADLLLVDALENCSLSFRAFYVWTYWAMIRCAPSLWNKFFKARKERGDEQTAPVWMWQKGCKKVFEVIKNFQPDAIIACEVGACEIAVIARQEKLTEAKIINVITDFEAEPIWIKPEISAYAVATESVKKQLCGWGAQSEQIHVCGIPVNATFCEKYDTNQIRSRFDLDARPIVLLMGGGMGPTRMQEVAARILRTGENIQVVALPGTDKKAERALKSLIATGTSTLRIIGWTNLVAPLMQTAHILGTKPGGVTLSEAASCGLPLVLFDAIPGLEEANAEYFVEAGAAVQTKGSNETAAVILRLLRDAECLGRMSAECGKLARPDAARKIFDVARQNLDLMIDGDILPISRESGDPGLTKRQPRQFHPFLESDSFEVTSAGKFGRTSPEGKIG